MKSILMSIRRKLRLKSVMESLKNDSGPLSLLTLIEQIMRRRVADNLSNLMSTFSWA